MRFLTTVVGSHPPGDGAPEEAIGRAVEDQFRAGIHILSDGQVRADMIRSFADRIPGFSRREPYLIDGAIGSPEGPLMLEDWQRARAVLAQLNGEGLRRCRVKAILTGPTTLAMACRVAPEAPYGSNADPRLIRDLAAVLAEEAQALQAAGAEIIQVDEPFFSLGADLDLGLAALGRVLTGVETPVLHACGDLMALGTKILQAPVAVIDIESSHGRLPAWTGAELAAAGIHVGMGVVDSSTDRVESVDEVRQAIARGVEGFGEGAIAWLSPDCGMRLRRREAVIAKLKNMAEAAAGEGGFDI